MVTGHRIEKLATYDISWIRDTLADLVFDHHNFGYSLGMSGMASGVDLWFCDACLAAAMPYVACVPFVGQEKYMTDEDAEARKDFLSSAVEIRLRFVRKKRVKPCES
jgi:hypothetical protein